MTDRPPSVEDARRALERAAKAAEQAPANRAPQLELARAQVTLSQALLAELSFGEADLHAEQAVLVTQRLRTGEDESLPNDLLLLSGLAGVQRGVTLLELLHAARREDHSAPDRVPDHLPPEPQDALTVLAAAVADLDRIPDQALERTDALPLLASAHGSIAVATEADGRVDDAFPHLHAALRFAEQQLDRNRGDLRAKAALALAHNALGHHYATTDRAADARSHHEQSLEHNQALCAAEPAHTHWRFCLATDHENLCDLWMREGDPLRARPHAEACAAERATLAANPSAPLEWHDQHADALRDLAEISFELRDIDAGFAAYAEMLAVLRELATEPPAPGEPVTEDALFRYADGLLLQGYACEEQLRWKEALRSFEAALEVDRQLIERQPDELRWHANAAHCHLCIALARLELGDRERSDAAVVAGRELLDEQLQRRAGDISLLRDISHFHTELAAAHARRDEVDRAVDEYLAAERAEQRILSLAESDHSSRAALASIHDNLAALSERRGDLDAALRHGQQAVRHEERLVQLDPESVPYQNGLLRALLNLSNTSLGREDPGRAEQALRTLRRAGSLALRLSRLVPEDEEVAALAAQVDRATGEAHRDLGDLARAEEFLRKSTGRLDRLVAAAAHPETWYQPLAESLEALAEFRLEREEPAAAIPDLERAGKLRRDLLASLPEEPAAWRELARTEETLADALEATGAFDQASEHRESAREIFERYGQD